MQVNKWYISIYSVQVFKWFILHLYDLIQHFLTQIYLPIKRDNSAAITSLLQCLEEVKSWLAQHFLFLNEDKTEVIVFGSNENSQYIRPDLDSLSVF